MNTPQIEKKCRDPSNLQMVNFKQEHGQKFQNPYKTHTYQHGNRSKQSINFPRPNRYPTLIQFDEKNEDTGKKPEGESWQILERASNTTQTPKHHPTMHRTNQPNFTYTEEGDQQEINQEGSLMTHTVSGKLTLWVWVYRTGVVAQHAIVTP